MTPYVLDTDTLTLFQRNHAAVVHHIQQYPLNALAVAVISVEEQLTGWQTRLRRAQRRDELARIYQRFTDGVQCLAQFCILSFAEPAILRYEQLSALKLNIGKMDLRIAAIVLEHGGTLVTRNQRDFQRVPGLAIVDWSV